MDTAAQGHPGRADQSNQGARGGAPAPFPSPAVRFEPTAESLKTYQTPEWFRDAKFGIWAHWGPQAVPR